MKFAIKRIPSSCWFELLLIVSFLTVILIISIGLGDIGKGLLYDSCLKTSQKATLCQRISHIYRC